MGAIVEASLLYGCGMIGISDITVRSAGKVSLCL